MYGSVEGLTAYLDIEAPPARGVKLLQMANDLIGAAVLAPFDVDDDGVATEPDRLDALTTAVYAQVQWWIDTGDATDATAKWMYGSQGGLSWGRVQRRLAPAASDALFRAGLLYSGIST